MIHSLERIEAPVTAHRVVSHDGTEIAYYVAGRGPRTWVIPPGIATPLMSWKHVIERFQDAWTLVVVDPRGTYGSGHPLDPWALTIEDHAHDIRAVVQALSLDRFVLGGWSMGCQISLDYYSRYPEQVAGLVLINGPYANALATLLPQVPGSERLLERVARGVLKAGGRRLTPMLQQVLFKATSPLLWKATGMLARDAADHHVQELFEAFEVIDFEVYVRFLIQAHQHSAAHVLPRVDVPTLITSGGRDRMTPVAVGRHMHQQIRGSEHVVLADATHYALVEYPDLLNDTLGRFLGQVGAL